jgi:hypothetical protein
MNKNKMKDVIQKWNTRYKCVGDEVDAFKALFFPMDKETTTAEIICWLFINMQKGRQRINEALAQRYLAPYLSPTWKEQAKRRFFSIWNGTRALLQEMEKNPAKNSQDILTLYKEAAMLQYETMEKFVTEVEEAFKEADRKREAEIRQALEIGMGIYQKGEEV